MGDRKCEFDGCNALEFRTSGYCLRHKGGSPDEKNPLVTSKPEETRQKPIFDIIGRTEIWWIPLIPLASFPLFYFALWYTEQVEVYDADPSFLYDLVGFVVFSACSLLILCSPILLPIYSVYLVRITRQRIENGEWNLFIAVFHILSFISPLSVLLVFWILVSALGGA